MIAEYYQKIELKPISLQILQFLYDNTHPMIAAEIAEGTGLAVRQIDAAVTKTLVRYDFAKREYRLTRVMKREYAEIRITDLGKRYIEFINEKNNK